MKKISYKMADAIFLVFVFVLLFALSRFSHKILSNKDDAILLILFLSFVFIGFYTLRYYFRPTYEETVKFKSKGWKVTGYYSARSLKNKKAYYKSYIFWAKGNIVLMGIETALVLIFYLINGRFAPVQLCYVHIALMLAIQVVMWFVTRHREKANVWKN